MAPSEGTLAESEASSERRSSLRAECDLAISLTAAKGRKTVRARAFDIGQGGVGARLSEAVGLGEFFKQLRQKRAFG